MMKSTYFVSALAMGLALMLGIPASAEDGCITVETTDGSELTAKVVNEDVIPGETIDIESCDIGVYLSEPGHVVEGATIKGGVTEGPEQYGVYVDGTSAEVEYSTFKSDPNYGGEIVHVAFKNGASGGIVGNEMNGVHRVGVLVDGEGSSATVMANEINGVGPKTDGWAENGIQVSYGATARVMNNVVQDHWWDAKDWASSGILVFGSDGVMVRGNEVVGNELGVAFDGDGNHAVGNTIAVDHGKATFPAGYGVVVYPGENNRVVNNVISGNDQAYWGVLVWGATNTKVIRNRISGFLYDVDFIGDEDTKAQANFLPFGLEEE